MKTVDAAFPVVGEQVGRGLLDLVRGCTFDDFILAPQRSIVVRRDPAVIDLSCRLSRRITLNRPIVSANMDTVTRAPMAIVQAEEGGLGIIDRGFRPGEIEPQVREVEKVKRAQHGVIGDPSSVRILGELTPVYVLVSGFTLHPVVGVTHEQPSFQPAAGEVADILEVSLDHLRDASRIRRGTRIREGVAVEYPYFDLLGHQVWGATAMILGEFICLI